MKKKVTIVLGIISIVAISTMIMFSIYKSSEAYRKANAAIQWDCSVTCAEESTPDSYVITYSDAKISSKTGVLTVQNRNDFNIIADIFGTIPVAEALLYKGAQLGTVLSFMMAVTTLSLPSLIMLRKAVKPKLLALFIGICTIGIILVGYLFNAFQFLLI